MSARIYATLAEFIRDQGMPGVKNENASLVYLRAASAWLEGKAGEFIPYTAAKRFDGDGSKYLFVPPLLSVTSIVDDATTLETTDYLLYPRNVDWTNGPYTWLEIDPDAPNVSSWTRERDIVVITGSWGKYNESMATGATTTQADASTTALVVDRADEISPGAVLLIESEQELVTATGAASNVTSLTDGAITSTATIITIDTGGDVYAGETILVDSEAMYVYNVVGNNLTVGRGWNGTSATTHTDDTQVQVYRTFVVERGVNGTTAAAHSAKAVSRYIPPWDVRYLVIQVAALMERKAASGYAGKVGDINLGEVFYNDEFPKKAYEEILSNYEAAIF